MKSKDASRACADSRVDVRASGRNPHVANMLNRHLRWKGNSTDSDNIVSLDELIVIRVAGSFYFGEYLSQGALDIEDKCQLVSAEAIINQGLIKLQPLILSESAFPVWLHSGVRVCIFQN